MKRNDDFVLKTVGGQGLLVPLGSKVAEANRLIALNTTGRCVWELLAEDRSVEEMAAEIAARFDVAKDVARTDVQAFLEDVERLGLLEE